MAADRPTTSWPKNYVSTNATLCLQCTVKVSLSTFFNVTSYVPQKEAHLGCQRQLSAYGKGSRGSIPGRIFLIVISTTSLVIVRYHLYFNSIRYIFPSFVHIWQWQVWLVSQREILKNTPISYNRRGYIMSRQNQAPQNPTTCSPGSWQHSSLSATQNQTFKTPITSKECLAAALAVYSSYFMQKCTFVY
jgi:hypothetical protein